MFSGPRAVGTWMGIQNAIGNSAGIIGPVITGIIIDRTGRYMNAFFLTAAVGAGGALIWFLALPRIEPISLD
jgi:MFS family permease